MNVPGGLNKDLTDADIALLRKDLEAILKDFRELKAMCDNSMSFMDRVDGTGILKKKTAEDLGVIGLAARSSGIAMDIRKDFPFEAYNKIKFNLVKENSGDALARFNVRAAEFEESANIITQLSKAAAQATNEAAAGAIGFKPGSGLGYTEGWRGAILYWVKLNDKGIIERCKIVDASFHNWEGLSFAVLGNIVPDFPLCNKSFNLSYPGNDL